MHRKILYLAVLLFLICGTCLAGELTSGEAKTFFDQAVSLQKSSNFEEADINYQRVLLFDPYNVNYQKYILNNRGIMFASLGDMDQAEALFKAALSIDPNYKPAQLNLGYIYENRRSRLESLEYWLKVLNINIDEMKPKAFVIETGKCAASSKK